MRSFGVSMLCCAGAISLVLTVCAVDTIAAAISTTIPEESLNMQPSLPVETAKNTNDLISIFQLLQRSAVTVDEFSSAQDELISSESSSSGKFDVAASSSKELLFIILLKDILFNNFFPLYLN
jgi:hypothetical protein